MPIHYEKDGSVASFVIDNGKVNVLTPAMHRELFAALTDFIADPNLRVGILSGAEGRSFCAGDDMKSPLPALAPEAALEAHLFPHAHEAALGLTRPGWEQDVMRLARDKPIVAAVDGYCLGQGLIYMLMLTDLRVATPEASFGFPEIAYGMGGAGGLVRLGRHVPHAIAMEMLLLGERIDAARAAACGLVNKIVPQAELMAQARAWADRIAAHPPVAVKIEMDAYRHAMDMPRDQAIDYAATLFRFQRAAYSGYGAGTGFLGREGK